MKTYGVGARHAVRRATADAGGTANGSKCHPTTISHTRIMKHFVLMLLLVPEMALLEMRQHTLLLGEKDNSATAAHLVTAVNLIMAHCAASGEGGGGGGGGDRGGAATVLPTVIAGSATDVEASALSWLHANNEVPLVIARAFRRGEFAVAGGDRGNSVGDGRVDKSGNACPCCLWKRLRGAALPQSRAVLLLLRGSGSESGARRQLSRLLPQLRTTAVWSPDALFIVVLTGAAALTERASWSGVTRALARAGAFRAVLLSAGGGSPVTLAPARRPPRPANPLWPPAAAADLSDQAMVFALPTLTATEEALCQNGGFDWSWHRDTVAARMVARALGARPVCFSERGVLMGARLPNGSYTGLAEAVHRGRAHALFYAIWAAGDWAADFYIFQAHLVEGLCLYVRRAQPLPFLASLLGALGAYTWLAAAVTVTSLAAARTIAGERSAVFHTAQTFLTGAFAVRTPSIRLRTLCVSTTLLSLLLLSAFQGSIISYLAVPRYGDEIDTLEEAAQQLKQVYVYTYLLNRFHSPDLTDVLYRLRPKFVNTFAYPEWFEAARSIVNEGEARALALEDRQSVIFVRRKSLTRDGFALIRRVPECVVSAGPVAFAARKHSPFASRADAVVARAVAAGLLTAIERRADPRRAVAFSLVRVLPGVRPLRPYPLARSHLNAAFAVWACGLGVATTMAVVERFFGGGVIRRRHKSGGCV